MKAHVKLIILILFSVMVWVSCKKDNPTPAEEQAPQLTQDVNQFIKDVMDDVYLWYKELPDIDIRYEFDSKAYFDKLLYVDDKWSFVTDDIQSWENSLQGIETSYGWSLTFGKFTDTGTVFALVEFVYPNTPAEKAGFKRGDMIYQMNNADITVDNYTDLLYADNLTCTYGQYTAQGITNVKTTGMVAQELELNPVQFTKIINESGHKIGYLFYAQFIDNFDSSLDTVFQHFIAEGVTDVVLDLRYNPGGNTTAAQYLCSSLAPASVVENNSTLVTFQWNDKYQQYWQQNAVMNQLKLLFINTPAYKMGLDKLHIITGQGTASASELTITGLKPYMDVTTVGGTTYGKYTASITLKPEDYYDTPDYYKDFSNWGVQPIILRYANSQGVTDFKNGFAPDIAVEDDLFGGVPLGDIQEPLLKAAIEDITGVQITAVAKKSAKITRPYSIFDRGFSRFDASKRELILKQFDRSMLLH